MVDILLSTYNGEKYIRTLLDSLLDQTYKDIHIIIRDDRSNDNTQNILKEYQKLNPKKIDLIIGQKNIGYIKSFEELTSYSKSEYLCFCDQDDFWYKDKIEKYIKQIEQKDNSKPILLFSDVMVVDEDLNVIHPSFQKECGKPKNTMCEARCLVQPSGGLGWTQFFNRALLNVVRFPIEKEKIPHDVWFGMTAQFLGDVKYLDEITGLYRQSFCNTSGYKRDQTISHKIEMLKFAKSYVVGIRLRAKIFKDTYVDLLSKEQIMLLDEFIKLSNINIIKRINKIAKYRFISNRFMENVANCLY